MVRGGNDSQPQLPQRLPHGSGRPQPAGLFEGRQTAGRLFFWWRLGRQRGGPDHGQQGHGPQGEGDVPMPAGGAAHLVLVQPHLPLGGLKAAFEAPARARHLHQGLQRTILRGQHQVGLRPDGVLTAAA